MFLPSMSEARSSFNVAIVDNMLYMAGGIGSGLIERFDPRTMTFKALKV